MKNIFIVISFYAKKVVGWHETLNCRIDQSSSYSHYSPVSSQHMHQNNTSLTHTHHHHQYVSAHHDDHNIHIHCSNAWLSDLCQVSVWESSQHRLWSSGLFQFSSRCGRIPRNVDSGAESHLETAEFIPIEFEMIFVKLKMLK